MKAVEAQEEPKRGPRGHSRVKGSGRGFSNTIPSISFRVTPEMRKVMEALAVRRNVSMADLARSLCSSALQCSACVPEKEEPSVAARRSKRGQ